jgi:hypothetical protein
LYCFRGRIAGLFAATPSWSSKNADVQQLQKAILEFIESTNEHSNEGS